jgi:hypothetical protein
MPALENVKSQSDPRFVLKEICQGRSSSGFSVLLNKSALALHHARTNFAMEKTEGGPSSGAAYIQANYKR